MHRHTYLLILVFLATALSVHAQTYSFGVNFIPIRDEIFLNEPAVFEIEIDNNGEKEAIFRVDVAAFTQWSAQTDPISHRLSGITIPAGTTEKTTLLLHPRGIEAGRTAVNVALRKEGTKEQISAFLKVNVRERYKIPIIEPKLELKLALSNDGKFDPREESLAQIEIKNKNQLDITDLSIKLKSSLIDEERSAVTLQPLERKKEVFILTFDPRQEPLRDSLVATVKVKNKTFVEIGNYEILPYTTAFKEDYTQEVSFLRQKTFIEVNNPANARKQDRVRYGTSFWRGMFTATQPKASVVEEAGTKYLEWQIALESGETTNVSVDINYRPLFYLIIAITVLVFLYFVLRSQVVIHKSVMRIGRREGGISEIKVVMNIRNRGNTPVHKIKIVDKIPHIATIVKQSEVGTLHPSSVTRRSKGQSLLKWEVENLEPHEERIINYTIKSTLSILGQLMLPVAVAKYKNAKNRTRKTRSNVLRLSA